MKLQEIKQIQEILEAVYESVEFTSEDLELMGEGDWLGLIEGISLNGYKWETALMVRCAVLLSGDCNSVHLTY